MTTDNGDIVIKNRTQNHFEASSSYNHWTTQLFSLNCCFSLSIKRNNVNKTRSHCKKRVGLSSDFRSILIKILKNTSEFCGIKECYFEFHLITANFFLWFLNFRKDILFKTFKNSVYFLRYLKEKRMGRIHYSSTGLYNEKKYLCIIASHLNPKNVIYNLDNHQEQQNSFYIYV